VTGLDGDRGGVGAGVANAARNGVGERVRVAMGDAEDWSGPPGDLVLANLLAPAFVTLAPALARACAGGGRLIAGGVLAHQVPVVVASLVPEGFELIEVAEREGWVALLLAHGQAALSRPA